MLRRPARAALWAVTLLLGLGVAWLLGDTASQLSNRLHDYGRWTSGKVALRDRPLFGAGAAMMTRVNLTREQLNLASWSGFQEFAWHEPLDLRELDVTVDIPDDHYLHLWFGEKDGRRVGVRLSHHARLPTAWWVADGQGRFLAQTPLDPVNFAPGRSFVQLRAEPDGFRLRLNGQDELDVHAPLGAPGRFGFLGGLDDAWVDDVRIEARDGRQWVERFDGPHPRRTRALAAGAVLLLLLGIRWLWTRRGDPASAPLPMIAALLVLGGCTAALRAVDARRQPLVPPAEAIDFGPYPQSSWDASTATTALFAKAAEPHPPGGRILFLGTSQTYGSGVHEAEDCWVERVCRQLNAEVPTDEGTPAFQCLNGGLPSSNSEWLWKLYRDQWSKLDADLVVIALGNNDSDTGALRANLRRILELARSLGSEVLLVGEPNASDMGPGFGEEKRAVLRALAAELGLPPVVEMQEALFARRNEGLLWWDPVHLSAFGQALFAEEVFPHLAPLALARRERARSAAAQPSAQNE